LFWKQERLWQLCGMDRSRAVVALALAVSTAAIILGLFQIGAQRRSQEFSAPAGALFSGGQAGVALVEVHGVIEDGSGGPGSPGADRIVERIRSAKEDPSVRGLLLSINSPGGSVGATKKIYDALIVFRKEKPIIAYITDIGASGGYYIAAAADRIYAYPGSIVGSIGVILIHPNADELLKKIGVSVTVVKAGRLKDSSYPFRNMTEEERLMHQTIADDAYDQFIRDLVEGRKQPEANVRKWGEGRIFSGVQARKEQIIDEFGGEDEAMQAMKDRLKTKDDLPILRPRKDFFEELMSGFSVRSRISVFPGRVYFLHPDSTSVLELFSATAS
jgi:protease-4